MRSLLSDIASASAPVAQAPTDSVRAAREAVLVHLRELCSTPRGSVLLAPSYGVEDATRVFHEYPGSVEDVRRVLEEAIRRYEPRLTNVSVRHLASDDLELILRFEIQATITAEGRSFPVRFTSLLDGDNRVELR